MGGNKMKCTCGREVKDHPAEPCLDELFYKVVMGWDGFITIYSWTDRKRKKYPHRVATIRPNNPMGDYSAYIGEDGTKYFCGQPLPIYHIPHVSTNIADAMEGVKKADRPMTLHWHINHEWKCIINNDLWDNVSAWAETAPLAITRALIMWAGKEE